MKSMVLASALLAIVTSGALAMGQLAGTPHKNPTGPAAASTPTSNDSGVPEPVSMALASLGMIALGTAHRKRQR